MEKNIISGIIGAVIAGIVLYFVLGNPAKLNDLDKRINKLEGKMEVFTALRKDFEALQKDVGQTQTNLSNDLESLQKNVGEVQAKISKVEAVFPSISEESLTGRFDVSRKWGSAWLDLASVTNFQKGDKLRLSLGGNANKVLVRLLPQGSSPDETVGILPGEFTVPQNAVVEVELTIAHLGVSQVSIHGGPNPWGMYPLGANNGSPTLTKVELIRR